MNNDINYLQKIAWEEIRKYVKAVNPELAEIIDAIDPGKKYKLVKASYKFGDLIIKDGKLQLPDCPKITETDKNAILEELNYSSIPLTLLLNKESEIFVMEGERVIPLKVFGPGKLFGTFETLNFLLGKSSEPNWNVSAGARSIFTLPKISANPGLKRLRNHFSLAADTMTHSLSDHWYLFKQIANHQSFQEKWESTVIFFTKDWFSFKKKDNKWFDFQNYLFKQGWFEFQQFLRRDQLAANWKIFIKAITHRRLKPTSYIADTFKHLLLIPIGEVPAFRPTDSNLVAPIKGLQDAILNVYLLENYMPHIMRAELPEPGSSDYFYYSLSLPTLFEGTPDSKNNSSTIMYDVKMIKLLIETLKRDAVAQYSFLKNNQFEYFHVETDSTKEIKSTSLIPEADILFSQTAKEFPDRIFCAASSFWRGCIRIKV